MKNRVMEIWPWYLLSFVGAYLVISGRLWAIIPAVLVLGVALVKSFKVAKAMGAFGVKYMDPNYFADEENDEQ